MKQNRFLTSVLGNEKQTRKTDERVMLHYEGTRWESNVQIKNLGTEGNEERSGKEKCALCRAEVWPEMKRWREKPLNTKWLNINGEIAYKRVTVLGS